MTEKNTLAPNTVGALWMLGSSVFFSAMAVLIKYTGKDYSPLMQAFARQFPAFLMMIPVIIRLGTRALLTRHWKMMTARSLASVAGMTLGFYAYGQMSLAAANALSFTRSLWLVLLAVLVLGERPGPLRIGATLVGFAGVLVMLGPDIAQGMEVGLPALAMLASAALMSAAALGVKVASRDTPPIVIIIWSAALGALLTIPGAIVTWRTPTLVDGVLLAATGACGLLAQTCYIKGMQAGDAAAMAPIDYTRLILLAAAGYFLFGELPTIWIVLGALTIAGSTLAITLYEQRRASLARTADADPAAA